MRNFVILLLSLISSTASAAEFSLKDVQNYIDFNAEIYVLDAKTGALLGQEGQYRTYRANNGKIDSPWYFDIEKKDFGLQFSMSIEKDQPITVKVTQFKDLKWKPVPGGKSMEGSGIAREEKYLLKMFEAISWTVHENGNKKWVVRFTPSLKTDEIPQRLDHVAISGTEISVYDNKGNLWTDSFGIEGRIGGLLVPRVGKYLIVSYYPFKGASDTGYATGNKIVVEDKGLKVTMVSSKSFYSGYGRARVFFKIGEFKPTKGTSAMTFARDKEDGLEDYIKKMTRTLGNN